MGSPAESLNIPEALRAWYSNGLEYLFLPEGMPEELAAMYGQPSYSSSASMQQAPASPGPASVQPQRRAASPVQAAPSAGVSAPSASASGHNPANNFANDPAAQSAAPAHSNNAPRPQRRAPQSPTSQSSASQSSASQSSAPQRTVKRGPLPQLPSPWGEYLNIADGASRRIVVTYVNLGLDLGGQPDNERRLMFKRLISYLGWPQGTAAFWPCSVLQGDVLSPHGNYFWQGVKYLGVRHIACFGVDALNVLFPYANPSRAVHYKNNTAIHLLPDPDTLAQMNGRDKVQAVSPLKGLFPDLEVRI